MLTLVLFDGSNQGLGCRCHAMQAGDARLFLLLVEYLCRIDIPQEGDAEQAGGHNGPTPVFTAAKHSQQHQERHEWQ